jgi:hypothetical protein
METLVKKISNKEMKRPFWYRRNYCVAPRAQITIVGMLAGIAIISSLAICYTAHLAVMDLGKLFNGTYPRPPLRMDVFQYISEILVTRLIKVVCAMVVIFILAGIYLTHHLAGPVWKLENELKKFLNGEKIPPMRFRRWDAFQGLPALINKLLEGYKR